MYDFPIQDNLHMYPAGPIQHMEFACSRANRLRSKYDIDFSTVWLSESAVMRYVRLFKVIKNNQQEDDDHDYGVAENRGVDEKGVDEEEEKEPSVKKIRLNVSVNEDAATRRFMNSLDDEVSGGDGERTTMFYARNNSADSQDYKCRPEFQKESEDFVNSRKQYIAVIDRPFPYPTNVGVTVATYRDKKTKTNVTVRTERTIEMVSSRKSL